MEGRNSRRWLITASILALVAHVMFALHYAFDLLGLISEPQPKRITGTLNVTLEPVVAGPYTLTAKTGSFTLTGGDVPMRVGRVPSV